MAARRPGGGAVAARVGHARTGACCSAVRSEEAVLVGVCVTEPVLRPEGRATGSGLPVRLLRRWLSVGEREGLHTHAFVELCYVQSGRGVLTTDGRTAVAAAHTISVLPPGTPHALAADGGWACSANLLHFDPQAVAGGEATAALAALLRLAASGHGSASLRGTPGQTIEALIGQIGTLARRPDGVGDQTLRAALADLCQRLLRQTRDARVAKPAPAEPGAASPAPAVPGSRPEIEHVLAYIERNLTRPISRQDLARQAAFAPSYFSALFRDATGTTIPEYINARRVLRAQELLRDPQTRVSAVCYAVGFRDLSNFNRVFKRLVGQTPREYRHSVLGEDYDGDEGSEQGEETSAFAPLSRG